MQAAKSLMPPTAGSEAVTLMGRLGYLARGVVYFLVGASAAIAAIWPAHRPAGPSDAVQLGSGQLGHGHPIGAIFLIAVAFGLACLAGWFTIAGLTTAQHARGRSWWRGLGMLGDAIVYIVFMIDVAGAALVGCFLIAAAFYGNPREAHEIGGVLAALRQVTYGRVLIGLFGLAFIGASLFDFVAAFYRRFDPVDA